MGEVTSKQLVIGGRGNCRIVMQVARDCCVGIGKVIEICSLEQIDCDEARGLNEEGERSYGHCPFGASMWKCRNSAGRIANLGQGGFGEA